MKTIKIIDLLTKRANGEGGIKKFKYHNIIWELNILDYSYYNESGIEFEEWLDDDLMNCLNDEIEIPDEEEEFEDIEPLVLKNFSRTGEAVTIDRFEDYSFHNFKLIEDVIAKVILNQKKIIAKLNKE